ncbi:hypothetical protein FACS1894169_01100 [Bacteroidia bacterium]|nr:hypothetical protein FACS1894169_01100 [Bacteroidia bacterium]
MYKRMKDKLKFQLITSAVLVIVGCGLLIFGISVPPVGVIDGSVLIAFGEILTFVGAIFGIDYKYKLERSKQEIGNGLPDFKYTPKPPTKNEEENENSNS